MLGLFFLLLWLAIGISNFVAVIQCSLITAQYQRNGTAGITIVATGSRQIYFMIRVNQPGIVAIIQHAHIKLLFSITHILHRIRRRA